MHWLAAAYLGFKPAVDASAAAHGATMDLRALLDALPGEAGKPKTLTLDMLPLIAML